MGRGRAYKLQEFPAHSAAVNSVKIGRKSSGVLVTGGDDKKVNMWAIGRPQAILSLHGHQSPVECVTFDAGEEFVVAGAAGGTIKVWDLDAARVTRTFTGHRSNCVAVDFHPFGDFFASGSLDTNLKVWDTRRKGCIHTYKGHTRGITHIRFSPDGRWVLSGSEDSTVKLWDLTAGKMLKEFRAHASPITAVEFHPNEFFMATSSSDRTTRFWDLESFEEAGACPADVSSTRAMCFRGDGAVLYSAHQDSLKVWGWEPVRGFDIVDVSWAKVSDISIHENKLLGAGFHQSFVGIWVVDLDQVSPEPGIPMDVRASTSSFAAAAGPHAVVGGAEIDSEVGRGSINNGDGNPSSLSRSFRRSMDITPSLFPQMFSQRDDRGAGEDDDSENASTPLSPMDDGGAAAGDEAKGGRMGRDCDEMDVGARMVVAEGIDVLDCGNLNEASDVAGAPEDCEGLHTRNTAGDAGVADDLRDGEAVENKLAEEKPGMVSVATVTGNSLRGQPLASLLELRQGLQDAADDARAGGGDIPSRATSADRERRQQTVQRSSARAMPPGSPSVNIDSFLPSSCGTGGTDADEELIDKLLEPHAKILTILSSRLVNVQLIHGLMRKRDYRGALTAMLRLGDISVAADVLRALPSHASALSLENCPSIIALSEQLLEQKHDRYIRIALDTIVMIVDGYGQLILDNITASKVSSVVDLNSESRRRRCEACVSAFKGLQPTLATTALRMDAYGEEAGVLSSRVDRFCSVDAG